MLFLFLAKLLINIIDKCTSTNYTLCSIIQGLICKSLSKFLLFGSNKDTVRLSICFCVTELLRIFHVVIGPKFVCSEHLKHCLNNKKAV